MSRPLSLAACSLALSVSMANAAEAPAFPLNSRWTMQFQARGASGASSGAGGTTFTIVSVERSAGTERNFGLVAGQRKYNALSVTTSSDSFLVVADLTVAAVNAGKLRVCAFGSLRPPQRSGLGLKVPPGQLEQVIAALRKRLAGIRASQPGVSVLTALRRAAGPSADGSTCTVRPMR